MVRVKLPHLHHPLLMQRVYDVVTISYMHRLTMGKKGKKGRRNGGGKGKQKQQKPRHATPSTQGASRRSNHLINNNDSHTTHITDTNTNINQTPSEQSTTASDK